MFEKNRIEAFSDGVIAIIITIMVLELKAPHRADISELSSLFPKFFSYILSFLYVGTVSYTHLAPLVTCVATTKVTLELIERDKFPEVID